MCVCVCVCVCVRACVRACVCVCVRACVMQRDAFVKVSGRTMSGDFHHQFRMPRLSTSNYCAEYEKDVAGLSLSLSRFEKKPTRA